MVASRFQGLFCEWHPKKPTCKKWRMKKNPKWCSSSFKCHTHNFFQFLPISFLLLKNSRWMMGFLLFRCREFLRCQKKSPSCWAIDGAAGLGLDILEKSQNCILLSPFAMHFFFATLLSTFSLDAKVSGKNRWHFIHSNESQLHALKKPDFFHDFKWFF